MNQVNRLIAWSDGRNFVSVRSFTLAASVYLLYEVSRWATEFADMSDRTGAEIALIVTAATGPATLLAGYAFKLYVASKQGDVR